MSQLPDSEYENQSSLEGEEEVDYDARPSKRRKQTARGSNAANAHAQQQMQMQMAQQRQSQLGQVQQSASYPMPIQSMQSMHTQSQTPAARRPAARTQFQPENDEYDLEDDDKLPRSAMETKQFLLHLLSTEILINTRLHGDFTW